MSDINDPFLVLYRLTDVVNDLESTRMANDNRVRALRKAGFTDDNLELATLLGLVDGIKKLEDVAVKTLEQAMKRSPLYDWAKAQRGIGLKTIARLLAATGNPYWHSRDNRPRMVSELWAYCGYHVLPAGGHNAVDSHDAGAAGRITTLPVADGNQASDTGKHEIGTHIVDIGVAPRRRRGTRSTWSTEARTRAFLVAEACMKQLVAPCTPGVHVEGCACGPYRFVYEATRAKYAEATHAVPCVRCGPESKPAPAGSPLSDGHKHARALRAIAKEVLKDMWTVMRDAAATTE